LMRGVHRAIGKMKREMKIKKTFFARIVREDDEEERENSEYDSDDNDRDNDDSDDELPAEIVEQAEALLKESAAAQRAVVRERNKWLQSEFTEHQRTKNEARWIQQEITNAYVCLLSKFTRSRSLSLTQATSTTTRPPH